MCSNPCCMHTLVRCTVFVRHNMLCMLLLVLYLRFGVMRSDEYVYACVVDQPEYTHCCMQVTHNGNDLWLSYWVSNLHSDRHPHHHHHPHRQLLGNRAPNSTHNMQHSNLSTHQTTPQDLLSNCASLPQELQQTDPYFSSYTTACSLQYAGFASSGWCSFQATPFQSPNASVTAEPCHTQDYSSVLESAISTATFHFDKHIPLLDPDTKFYLLVLLCIAAANSLFTFVRAFAFAYGGLAAARKLHEQLLSAIVQAPARFFHTTPSGTL